jgi:integrase
VLCFLYTCLLCRLTSNQKHKPQDRAKPNRQPYYGVPLLETTILNQGLYPALKALGLPQGGLHGFRRGCNRRWELAGINPAVIRQQMGHSSHRLTALYSGEIPLDQVRAAFSRKLLEKMENEVAAQIAVSA